MNALRQRLPAPRQDQAARKARNQGGDASAKDSYEPSRMAQLAGDAPPWYHSAARRRLYFLLFPAAVVSYATSGYALLTIHGLVLSYPITGQASAI